jgi:hypothetical protein
MKNPIPGLMSLIAKALPNPDKWMHAFIGMAIQLVVRVAHPSIAMLAVAAIMWAKEERDRKDPERHTKDGWDAFAGVVGAIAVEVALLVLSSCGLLQMPGPIIK